MLSYFEETTIIKLVIFFFFLVRLVLVNTFSHTIICKFLFLFISDRNSSQYLNMPGNIKKTEGPDPDPSPWLLVSPELKIKLKSKPYDPKKSCWVPNKATHGYDEGLIESTEGDKVTVVILENQEVNFEKGLTKISS